MKTPPLEASGMHQTPASREQLLLELLRYDRNIGSNNASTERGLQSKGIGDFNHTTGHRGHRYSEAGVSTPMAYRARVRQKEGQIFVICTMPYDEFEGGPQKSTKTP